MNIFFGIKTDAFKSTLNIPKFKNDNTINSNYSLYLLKIVNAEWVYEKIDGDKESEFYFINSDISNNENIFLISKDTEMINLKKKNEILDLNSFTNSSPAYRANLKIKIKDGGFSSYQSEYPFSMTTKKGSILSPISTLLNYYADQNFLIFKNIFHKPINKNFKIYVINIKSKQILRIFNCKSNQTNIFEVSKDIIHSENFIYSKNYLGIPIYVSIKSKHVSMEHTHPPHEYILTDDKFYRVALLKKKFDEVIT